jgi:excisionase family DNA binding protein
MLLAADELLTVNQVSQRLNVHPETVGQWLREGRIKGMTLGRRGNWRIEPSAVDAFLAKRRRESERE